MISSAAFSVAGLCACILRMIPSRRVFPTAAFFVSASVFAAAPVVTDVAPASGRYGSTFTITGSGFTGASDVRINSVAGTATFTVDSDTQITAKVAIAQPQSGLVSVTTAGGTGVSPTGKSFGVDAPAWALQNPRQTAASLESVTFGAGLYVAVGSANPGLILTSTDGVAWTTSYSHSAPLRAVAYANNQFVAVGDAGAILSSADGLGWTVRSSPTGNSLQAVAYGAGQWVALGFGSSVATSTDGVTWSAGTLGTSGIAFRAAAFGASVFVGVGDSGKIFSSPDGVTWTSQNAGTTNQLTEVTFANGQFVAVGLAGVIRTSADGVTWTARTLPSGFTSATLNAVGYGAGKFVAAGNTVLTSADGITWTGLNADIDLRGLVFANNQFVGVGAPGLVFTSPDGTSFTMRTSLSRRWWGHGAYGNGRYLLVGDQGSIAVSTDAQAWTVQQNAVGNSTTLNRVVYGRGLYVAVGFSGTIATSPSGSGWKLATSGTTQTLYGVAYSGAKFVAVGASGTVLTSTDGLSWSLGSVGAAVTTTLYGVQFGAGRYVAVGAGGKIYHSPDAVTWTATSLGSADYYTVSFVNGQFVAVGASSTISTSTDGVTWSVRNLTNNSNSLTDVTGAEGLYVAAASSGQASSLFLSPDSVIWSQLAFSGNVYSPSGSTGQTAAVYGNGRYVVATYGGQIMTASPISDATRITTQPASRAIVAGDDVTLAVVAAGPSGLAYQWYRGLSGDVSAPVASATSASYTTGPLAGSAQFWVRVTAPSGASVDSATAELLGPPTILHQPSAAGASEGDTVTLSAQVLGTGPFNFQWLLNGDPIVGAVNSAYTFTAIPALNGTYKLVVTSPQGSVMTDPLLFLPTALPPTIKTNPSSQSVAASSSAKFTVVATGGSPLTYQWKRNGQALTETIDKLNGAHSPTLEVENAQTADAGSYTCDVTGVSGATVTSAAAALSVSDGPPTITQQPSVTSFSVAEGESLMTQDNDGNTVPFLLIEATGTGPLQYQWMKDGSPIIGATKRGYPITAIVAADAGTYTCVVSNPNAPSNQGTATSTAATVTVTAAAAPVITRQPNQMLVTYGGITGNSVDATGSRPLTYQWKKNGVAIAGATNPSIQFANVTANDVANYTVEIANAAGTVETAAVSLNIINPTVVKTRQPRPHDISLTTIAYGAGKFVAAGTAGHVRTSTDGITWTALPIAGNYGFNQVIFANNQFVAAGSVQPFGTDPGTGLILTSPDGVTWTRREVPLVHMLDAVTYGGGLYVATGRDGVILTSPDAITWTSRSSGSTRSIYGVAYGAGRYVALGDNVALSSTDGATWSPIPMLTALDSFSPGGVVYAAGRFVLVAGDGYGYSTDGLTWTPAGANLSDSGAVSLPVFANGEWIGVAADGNVHTSSDAALWQARPSGSSIALRAVAYGGGLYVAVGDSGQVMTSLDGRAWASERNGELPPTGFTGAANNGSTYVVVGVGGLIATSSDGLSWTQRTSGTARDFLGVTYGGGRFVAVGGTSTVTAVSISTDGTYWQTTEYPSTPVFRAIAYDGANYIAVGNSGRIYTSTNATTWTQRASFGSTLRAVTVAGGTAVAVGNGGAIYTAATSNLASWTSRSSGTTNVTFTSVAYGSGVFVAAGLDGTSRTNFAVSTDGLTWTLNFAPYSSSINGLVYTGGRFYSASGSSAVLSSADGVTWTPEFSGTTNRQTAITYGPAGFISVGDGGSIIGFSATRPPVVTSLAPTSLISGAAITITGTGFTDATSVRFNGLAATRFTVVSDTQITAEVPLAAGSGPVIVTTAAGSNIPSAAAQLGVTTAVAPGITTQPASVVGAIGDAINLTVAATGTPAPSYQWSKDGAVLPNATNATLAIASATAADTGSYTCTVTNSLGSLTSAAATIALKPAITAPPVSLTVLENGTATFSVAATGSPTLAYAWFKNGSPLGVTTATLTLANVALTSAGTYTVSVTNAAGSVTSTGATLAVTALVTAPAITQQPVGATVNPGASVAFSVEASGTAPFTYVWKRGTTIVGSNSATLSLANVTAADAGSYTVTISNSAGSATSTPALLAVNVAPAITAAPASLVLTAGAGATFTVAASGTAPLSYAWAKNGLPLPGATTATYNIGATTLGDTGSYTCTVSNVAGSATASATLTVNPAIFPPSISSAPTAAVAVNSPFTYAIVASNSPTSYGAAGLPAGLALNAATGVISGTPATAGTATITLTAANAGGTGTATLTLTVIQPVPVVTSAARATGRVGTPFTYTITATNAPTSYAASGLPAGLTLNAATGAITGSPTTAGNFTATLTASNAAGASTGFTLTLAIAQSVSVPVVTSATTATGKVGDAFTYQITANNTPTSYAASGLPAGLALNATSGAITGTPTAAGTFSVSVSASNSGGNGPALALLFTIAPAATAPVITSSTSAAGTIGTAFSYAIVATNNPTAFTAAPLPAGLAFDAATGRITGSPTTAGTTLVALGATNAAGTGSATLTLDIVPGVSAPAITSSSTAAGKVGLSFTYAIVASNAPTTFTAVNLPAGLTLNATTGVISGTPTAAGTFNAALTAGNAAGTGAVFTLTLTIAPAATAPKITSVAAASGITGTLFTYQITATNGPLTAYTAAGLPDGVALNPLTGLISGTPAATGFYNVTLTASNAVGVSAPLVLLLDVQAPALAPVVTSSQNANGTQAAPFTYTITASNMPAALPLPPGNGYTATGLPAGLVLNPATGQIAGTPSVTGTFVVTLAAFNDVATSAARALTLTIAPAANAPVINSSDSAAATAGTAFSYTITASNSPTSFDALGRPAWLSINTATGVLSGTPTAPEVYTVQLVAANATGTSAPATLTISAAPAAGSPIINSGLGASGQANNPFAYQITASSPVAISYFQTFGLPGGLALDPVTGLISGIPTVPGTYNVAIRGVNPIGIGATKTLVIAIAAAPGSPIIGGSGAPLDSPVARALAAKRAGAIGVVAAVATLESSATVGVPYSYQIAASGTPTSFSADGLPTGLAVNPSTGLISGAPAVAGVFEVLIRASNDIGVGASATLLLTVAPPATTPTMTSAFTATGTAGAAFSYTATASNSPTSYNASGLPAGLALDSGTGLISGTPTTPGTYTAKLSANNSVGTGPVTTVTLTIAAAAGAPAITSAPTAGATVGAAFSYAVTATNAPTSYTASGLPPGLAIDAASGVISGTPGTDGEFKATLTARNAAGLSTPFKLTITVVPPGTTPTITSPASASVTVGTTFAYAATATNSPGSFNITNLPAGLSANSATGLIDGVPTTAGTYSIRISANNDSGTGAPLTLTLEVVPVGGTPGVPGGVGGSRLINISTRGVVGTGDKVLIAGFVITGSEPKPVMIRAVGPALVAQGVSGELRDPTLELVRGSVVLGSNDDWSSGGTAAAIAATATRVGAFALANGSAEAVIVTTLQPGVYSAVAHGKGSATGVALIEVYDTSEALPATAPRLVNLSARGDVGTGGNILFGGFVITGDTPRQVMLRAVGPGLAPLGVSGALADPKLQVFRGGVLVNENDNWGSAGDAAAIATTATTVGAFALTTGSKDAVVLTTLQPGAYTMQVSGVGATTGIAMVEIYEVP